MNNTINFPTPVLIEKAEPGPLGIKKYKIFGDMEFNSINNSPWISIYRGYTALVDYTYAEELKSWSWKFHILDTKEKCVAYWAMGVEDSLFWYSENLALIACYMAIKRLTSSDTPTV